jgi:hypothetical protein
MIRISRKAKKGTESCHKLKGNPSSFPKLTCEKPAEIKVGADGSLPLKEERLSGQYMILFIAVK